MKFYLTLAAGLVAAAPIFAESHGGGEDAMEELVVTGDAAAGEKEFRKCVSCHVVVDDEGETLAGRRARTGPNLYGIAGGNFGEAEDFRYGKGAEAAAGTMMDEANFVAYVQDPTAWLRDVTGDSKARSKMTYRVRSEDDAKDIFAYLHSLQQ